MRLKFLLFIFLLWGGVLSAQDTINYLVITEYRGDNTHNTYLELTNMGDNPVQLNQFKIGWWGGGSTLDYQTGKTNEDNDYWIPVDSLLPPGESYVFATVENEEAKLFARGYENVSEKQTQDKMREYADYQVHIDTLEDGTIKEPFNSQWGPGMNGFYIEQHLDNGDSIVVDQVLGMFTGENGQNLNRTEGTGYDIAGVTEGTATCYLIRKNSVKTGTLDFNSARGVDLEDSEWIPIPHHGGAWRDPLWTVGNQGDYNLDANTLEPTGDIEVDFENKTLTIPWGIRRGDDIMNYFVKKPGIGWEYVMAADADSLTHAAQTGDQLLIYVCGDDLDFATFDIVVKEPAEDANKVVPVSNEDPFGNWREDVESGYMDWPRITQHESGNDTIWGVRGGIPYGTRVDSLLERLEKPSNAEWEIEYASGIAKPDLADGDKLKVTAQDGSVKEYFISVNAYRANTDATLSSISWPDIPEFYKGLFGWVGDTIPGFNSQVFNYNVQIPLMADGMPALVGKKSDTNAKLKVDRATSLSGHVENRTVNFTVTAEDDTTINNYRVTLTKEQNPDNIQPYHAEPFISEIINNVYWTNDGYVEICNPGNQPLDLSDYMIVGMVNPNPAEAIAQTNETSWLDRYDKYIPGYKWAATSAEWGVEPYIAQLDLSVGAIVQPGDVFVLGAVQGDQCETMGDSWPALNQLDVQFLYDSTSCRVFRNQWGEEIGNRATPCNKFRNAHIYLFKILNDSIKKGLKSATDPNDFDLIDVFGMGENAVWEIDGVNTNPTPDFRRKPEIHKGNPVIGESLGVNSADDVEWDWWNHKTWASLGFGWPDRMTNLLKDLGKHFFYPPTEYMSTVSSLVYKVSEGYTSNPPQEIKGITTGTIVADFLENIIKKDTNQTLTLTSAADGSVLLPEDLLSLNDTLSVLSADSTNLTKYVLNVSEDGLSSDAILTSTKYQIEITQQPAIVGETKSAAESGTGTVSGFEYGTAIQTIVNNVTVPGGASMQVISGDGAYVPNKILNFDSTYVTVTVNADTYFEVTAEDGTTIITYQLIPQATESDAFVTSDVYNVVQSDLLIKYVPRGTNVQSFLSNVIPAVGASMKLIDKWGFERVDGVVADDDKLVVTSADGTVTTTYYISKLATEYAPESTYLAYILSNVYSIDQVEYKVYGASGTADISEFYSRIKTAEGATAVVVDENGMDKTSGTLTRTDKVKVTSADGKITVMYTFGQLTDASLVQSGQIEIYPNPTSGRLNVLGVESGQRIQVYNSVGSIVIDANVESNHEVITLDRHPAGMYLIVVSDKNKLLGKYKAVKY